LFPQDALPSERAEALPEVLRKVEASVAATGDHSSRFDRPKVLPGSVSMYVFRVDGPRRCPYGHKHDGSNNFNVQVRETDLLYYSNGSHCQSIRRLLKIEELSYSESIMGGETGAVRAGDFTFLGNLTKDFVDCWALQQDLGGSKIVGQMYSRCGR
jgi:hypothetical protein